MSLTGSNLTAATTYVWQDSPDPKNPYASWPTAAHELQPAINLNRLPGNLGWRGGRWDDFQQLRHLFQYGSR